MSQDIKQRRRTPLAHVKRGFLGSLLALAACSSAPDVAGPAEGIASQAAGMLSTPCTVDSSGDITLTVAYGEIAYLGYQAGGAVANALSKYGGACQVAAGKKITVVGQGGAPTTPEKLVLDYTQGLFGMGATSVTLDTAPGVLSEVVIAAPSTGSNMALGTSGIDLNTLYARGSAVLDVALKWSTTSAPGQVVFDGSSGNDAFVADAAGLSAVLPASLAAWDTAADISRAVGAAFAGPLTLNGGPGNDVLAGGAGPNILLGGPGDDTFPQSTSLHAETILGGDGWDTVDYSARTSSQPVTATLGIDGAVVSISIGNPGSGYAVNDVLTLVGAAPGNVTPATVTVTSVTNGGAITGLSVATIGAGYATQNGAATTGGKGTAATVNILQSAVALVAIVDGGLLYQANDVLTITPASGTPATVKVDTVSKTGAILTTSILAGGGGFSDTTYPYVGTGGPSSVSGGSGANASLQVTALLSTADDGCVGEGDSLGGYDGLGDNDVEVVIGGAGNDYLDARNVLTDVVLEGGAGNDKLRGGAGRDDLCGGPGDDVLQYSGCSRSAGCSVAAASGDFLSGSGGVGGGAASADSDTAEYLQSPTGVVVCLNPADPTCSAQQGAASGQFDTMNDTNLVVCPSARPFLIACNGVPIAYTPGAGTTVTSVASASPTMGHAGSGFAVGDLVTISGGAAVHLAVAQVTTVGNGGSVTSLVLLNAGSGYAAGTGNATSPLAPSQGSSLQADVTLASTGDYWCSTSPAVHPQVPPGIQEKYDMANITGHPTLANVMDCDGHGMTTTPVTCTLVGGLNADLLQGSVHGDAIYGNGNGDTVLTNGGADLVDLTFTGVSVVESLDCDDVAVTVIYHANDVLHCRGQNDSLGTYSDTGDQCTQPGNTCHLAYFLPE